MSEPDQLQQCGHCGTFLLHPHVHGLLDGPGGFPEAHEAHHAPAAFQGVETAADRRERFFVGVLFAQRIELLPNRCEHLVGLLQIDPQELGVDRLGTRVDELGSLRRW